MQKVSPFKTPKPMKGLLTDASAPQLSLLHAEGVEIGAGHVNSGPPATPQGRGFGFLRAAPKNT
jgi:hypothetical protein